MSKIKVNQLEIHTSEICNLRCVGCTSFSDYKINHEFESWQINKQIIQRWAEKINISSVTIAGGEPFMHPEIIDVIVDLRLIFPDSMINVVTNGSYIAKKIHVVDLLSKIGHACLTISDHEPDKNYINQAKKLLLNRFDWKTSDVRPDWLETNNRFYLELRSSALFISPLAGEYGQSSPHHSDPTQAFNNCCFHNSLNYYQGKLYKCSPLQYLNRALTDWEQQHDPDWQKYLDYRPLSIDCSDNEMTEFFSHYNKPEEYCSMCPTSRMLDGQYLIRGQWKNPIIPLRMLK